MLELVESIDAMENAIMAGKLGFFINTQFGKLAVEIPNDFDVMNPVTVDYWDDAPKTKWTMKNNNKQADIYVSIGVHDKENIKFVRMKSIEAFHRAFFLAALGVDIGQDVSDAAVIAYTKDVEKKTLTRNFIESEYLKIHFNPITRNDQMVHNMVSDIILSRQEAAKKVQKFGDIFLSMNNNIITFATQYNRDIFSIVCYILANIEDPSVLNRHRFSMICDRAIQYLAAY